MYKLPEPSTDFKLALHKACEKMGIPFSYTSVKDVTVDEVVNEMLQNLDVYRDVLNQTLRKQNTKQSSAKYVVNALNKGINNPADQRGHLEDKESITLYHHEYMSQF